MDELKPIDRFRIEIMQNLASTAFELEIVDETGHYPVVAVLEEEHISVLARRVAGVGGYANVFVRGDDHVSYMAFVPEASAFLADEAEDLSAFGAVAADATVGMLVDYAKLRPTGLKLPETFSRAASEARVGAPREVSFV